LPASLAKLDHYLRDSRTGDVHHFDPHLFDLLYDLASSVGDNGGEIDVVCGYRTPESNEFLRTRGSNASCRCRPPDIGWSSSRPRSRTHGHDRSPRRGLPISIRLTPWPVVAF
jgi:hypothetical protein